ncbi:MAG: hypothetical protein AAF907_02225, partial [Planctomycetota bacterium]
SIFEDAEGRGQALGEAGQVTVVTGDGVAFDLDFGELFTGDSYDFAVGDAGEGYRTLTSDEDEADAGGDATDDEAGEAEPKSQGRYLFVMARVDETALGDEPLPPPVKPTPPEEPSEGSDESANETEEVGEAEEAEADATETDEPPAGEEPPEGAGADPALESDDAEPDAADPDDAAPAAETPDPGQAQYEEDLAVYLAAKAEYDRKLAAAKERVEELNRRFGDWYYVVDAAEVADLPLTRDALLDDPPADEPAADAPLPSGLPPIEAPGSLQDLINGMTGDDESAANPEGSTDPENEADGAAPEAAAGQATDPAPGETGSTDKTDSA